MAIGLLWWTRRPASRFGPLLIVFGIMCWVIGWESSSLPLPFDLGVLFEAPMFWLTFYLFLAFPMGRLEPPAARWLMAALALGIATFFLPWALFSPVRPAISSYPSQPSRCSGSGVRVGPEPSRDGSTGTTPRAILPATTRSRAASRPERRTCSSTSSAERSSATCDPRTPPGSSAPGAGHR